MIEAFKDAAEREVWAAAYAAERKRGAGNSEALLHADSVLREFQSRSGEINAPR